MRAWEFKSPLRHQPLVGVAWGCGRLAAMLAIWLAKAYRLRLRLVRWGTGGVNSATVSLYCFCHFDNVPNVGKGDGFVLEALHEVFNTLCEASGAG